MSLLSYNPLVMLSRSQVTHTTKPTPTTKPTQMLPKNKQSLTTKQTQMSPTVKLSPTVKVEPTVQVEPAYNYLPSIDALCEKYNVTYTYDKDAIGDATGIGDILFRMLCIKYKLIPAVFTINLTWFTELYYSTDPINQLEFRLQLLRDLCKYNDIPSSCIKYVFAAKKIPNNIFPYESITNFKLNIAVPNTIRPSSEYIIFHTKCRHTSAENYAQLKADIKTFCATFKSDYTIIIMGERTFPTTAETIAHNITTVYTELLHLHTLNTVEDKSVPIIYTNLDYDTYTQDIDLIQHAKYNICFGLGGQLCTSLLFSKSTVFYCKVYSPFNSEYLNDNNHYQFSTTKDLFTFIRDTNTSHISPSLNRAHIRSFNRNTRPIEITPHIGIGDLIIIKLIEQTWGLLISKINISTKMISTYSMDFVSQITLLKNIIALLFPTTAIALTKKDSDFTTFCAQYPITTEMYLYDSLNPKLVRYTKKYSDCIVFHTKVNHVHFMDRFNMEILPALTSFFTSFKTKKQIIILGERIIGRTTSTRVTKCQTIYNELLLLNTNNTVIDLTKGVLTEGVVFDEFLDDISIINNSACNITFGNGGPFVITSAFAKNRVALIPYVNECTNGPLCKLINTSICTSVAELETRLSIYQEPGALTSK